jgi:prepilin-type N-terminal cleavage/methylation domain-containing protein
MDPILHALLAYHPFAFVAVKVALTLVLIGLILLTPRVWLSIERRSNMNRKSAFTPIELLVVIAIIAILAALLLPVI